MKELCLLLGTNLGRREDNMNRALKALDKAFYGRRIKQSPILETEACDFIGPPFLNMTVVYSSARRPETILKICKQIERSMGRSEAPEYALDGSRIYHNRIIDIDILTYGDLELCTPTLTIPHPQVKTRPFVATLLDALHTM